uniref:GPR54 n=1 Tax=Stichopus japonicus TaxID=307972 RepID=A0A385HCX4_STIJA|nr:GPR54 [Apostichopus japonicus]
MADTPAYFNDTEVFSGLTYFSYCFDLSGSILFTLIAIVGIVANGLVIYMVAKHAQLRTPMNYFITHLAAADLILLFVLVVPRDVNFFTTWKIFTYRASLIVIQYIQHICIQATALILAIMSISRYTMVVLPLKAKAEWTVRRVWMCCGAAWILSVLLYIPVACGILYMKNADNQPTPIRVETKIFAALKLVFIFLLPFSVIVFCYSKIILTFRRGRYKLKRTANIDSDRSDDQTRKLARMVLVIILIFFFSWAPIQGYQTRLSCREHSLPTSPANWKTIVILGFFFRLFAYLGSAINPFIYAYTNPSFKRLNMFRIRKMPDSVATLSSQL